MGLEKRVSSFWQDLEVIVPVCSDCDYKLQTRLITETEIKARHSKVLLAPTTPRIPRLRGVSKTYTPPTPATNLTGSPFNRTVVYKQLLFRFHVCLAPKVGLPNCRDSSWP